MWKRHILFYVGSILSLQGQDLTISKPGAPPLAGLSWIVYSVVPSSTQMCPPVWFIPISKLPSSTLTQPSIFGKFVLFELRQSARTLASMPQLPLYHWLLHCQSQFARSPACLNILHFTPGLFPALPPRWSHPSDPPPPKEHWEMLWTLSLSLDKRLRSSSCKLLKSASYIHLASDFFTYKTKKHVSNRKHGTLHCAALGHLALNLIPQRVHLVKERVLLGFSAPVQGILSLKIWFMLFILFYFLIFLRKEGQSFGHCLSPCLLFQQPWEAADS